MVARSTPEQAMSAIEPRIETPCIRACVLQAQLRLCIGCGRSLGEIEAWTALSNHERKQIMAQLPLRLQAVGGAGVAPAE